MDTWLEMADNNWQASLALWPGHPRSCLSRLYYAAYAAVAGFLEARGVAKDVLPSSGDEWYAHALLVEHLRETTGWEVLGEASLLSGDDLRRIEAALGRLRRLRVGADYIPEHRFTNQNYNDARRDARFVMDSLGAPGGA